MRKYLAFLVLLFAWPVLATTTVTGHIKDLSTNPVTSGTFVRFWLRGCAGNQPTVNGTAVIAPTSGGVYYFDFTPDGTGTISGTLYSTRDSTGNNGGDISCGGSTTSVWYGMQIWVNGKAGPEIPMHAKNGVTLDITNVTPISVTPVVTAPTGDNTYLRLDNTNGPAVNEAIKPAASDAVLYLSQNGNDLNDCKSWGSACLTVAHVESLLPTVTINSTQVPYGTVWVGANPSGYPIGTNITVNSPVVHYRSVDGFNTVFSCTASTCFTQNFSAIVGAPLEAWPNFPFLEGITLNGNGSASQVGIAVTDGDGFGLAYDTLQGFTGTGAQAVSVTNSAHESERMWFMRNWFIGNTQNVVLNGVSGHTSFGHNHFIDNDFDLSASTAAFTLTAGADLYDTFITSAINAPHGANGTYGIFSMDGAGTIVEQNTFVQLSGDVGGGTLVGVQFLTGSPTFEPAGKLSDVTTISTGTGTLASTLPTIGQHTGPGAAFQGAYTFSTSIGLVSTGGGTILHQAPNTAGTFTITDPAATGNVVVDSATQTETNKTLTSPVINTGASGTGLQGTDTKLMSAGTVSGTAAHLCVDANGGATTSGCSVAIPVAGFTSQSLNTGGADAGYYTFPEARTLVSWGVQVLTTPVGCTTNAILIIMDNTTTKELGRLTLSNGTATYLGTGSIENGGTVNAGDAIQLGVVLTPAAGCGTNPAGEQFLAWFK